VSAVTADDLSAFRREVLADAGLQAELLAQPERQCFVAALVEAARVRGLDIRPDDIERGIDEARRVWYRRWP